MNTLQAAPTAQPLHLSIADLSPEQLAAFLAQIPAETLKKAADSSQKTALQLQREKEQAYKELEVEVVNKVAPMILEWIEEGKRIKAVAFDMLKPLVDLKFEVADIKDQKVLERLKKQKSHCFNANGLEIKVGRRSKDSFDGTVKNGVAKIEEYINSKGVDSDISSILIELLEKDKAGSIKASSILALQNIEIEDDLFKEGVRIISEAWQKKLTCFYLEVGRENNLAKMIYEPTSLSAYALPETFEFNYFQDVVAE